MQILTQTQAVTINILKAYLKFNFNHTNELVYTIETLENLARVQSLLDIRLSESKFKIYLIICTLNIKTN